MEMSPSGLTLGKEKVLLVNVPIKECCRFDLSHHVIFACVTSKLSRNICWLSGVTHSLLVPSGTALAI